MKTGRHAYCLIVHADRPLLKVLLELIDDSRNDIYLLPDRKTPEGFTDGLLCRHSKITVVPPDERVDVRWGAPSLVEAELKVLEAALMTGGYDYLHLMSGADLPLRSQDEIHAFFDAAPEGSNFIELSEGEEIEKMIRQRVDYYYLFLEHQRKIGKGLWPAVRLFGAKVARHSWLLLQRLAGYRRKWDGLKFAQGINWASLSEPFSRYLVERRDEILRKFRGVLILDELYKQTMIINSPFDSTVRAYSRGNSGGIRLMDWKRGNLKCGNPYVWTMEDWEEIDKSYEPFARKFSSYVDSEVIEKVKERVLSR